MSPRDLPSWRPQTTAVAAGRPARDPGAPVNPPVTFSSTYIADGEVNYARVGNPTWSALEEAVGRLEGGAALVFGSGMAALAAVVSLAPLGGTVVAARHAYNGTTTLLGDLDAAGAVRLRRVDIDDTAQVVSALEGADLVLVESPTNPMMELADLPALVRAAHDRGVLVACDNTFATPVLQQPLAEGADVVVHSATKYLAGHSDVLLGAVVTPPDERGGELRQRLLDHRSRTGAIAGPMEAWLALRGLRTLHLRMERAGANAAELAARLRVHPAVQRVRYPGFGAMLAIEVAGGAPAAEQVSAAVRLWTHSTSLGGVESQLERRRRYPVEVATVPDNLLRLSVGIEHVEDLWADLAAALEGTVTG